MKIKINSTCDKKLYYRIYAAEGDKRAVLTKGSFIGSTEFELPHTGKEIIIRIRPKRGIKSFPTLFKTIIINFLHFLGRYPITPSKELDYYNIFNEIRITDCNRAEDMEITYNLSPVSENVSQIFHGPYCEYIVCKTHPYKIEEKHLSRVSDWLDIIFNFLIIGIIVGIAFIIGYFIRSC